MKSIHSPRFALTVPFVACVMIASALVAISAANAQCGSWFALGAGIGGDPPAVYVRAVVEYNGDLIAAGRFQFAGGQPANNIARWDGTSWHPMGLGTNNEVFALCVYQGELIAGGNFSQPAQKLAAWNGATWHAMGEFGPNGVTFALIEHSKWLFAGGSYFNQSGDQYCFARMPPWIQDFSVVGESTRAFAYHDGLLIAGGWYSGNNSVLRWDGITWYPMNTGMIFPVWELAVHNGNFYAANSQGLAWRWNGSFWQAVGGVGGVAALHSYDNQLIIGGSFFEDTNGSPLLHVARQVGNQWEAVGGGTSNTVLTLGEYKGLLIAGGEFTSAGGVSANRIAAYRCPANDGCANGPLVAAGTYQFNSLGASTDGPDEPASCDANGSNIQRDIWYKLLAQCTGTATVSLCGANFDTKIAVYGACPSASGQAIACDEDFCGTSSQVRFAVNAGGLYRIRIGSAAGEMGTGTMVITCAPTPRPCPADINGDQQVNVSDLLSVINAWGACPSPCAADINADGNVNVGDLLAVINAWGACL